MVPGVVTFSVIHRTVGAAGGHRFFKIQRAYILFAALLHLAKTNDLGVHFAETRNGAKGVVRPISSKGSMA